MKYKDVKIDETYILLPNIINVGIAEDLAGTRVMIMRKTGTKVWFKIEGCDYWCLPKNLCDEHPGQKKYTQLSFDFDIKESVII